MSLLLSLSTAAIALPPAPAAHAQSSENSNNWISSLGSSEGELSSGLSQGLSSGGLSSASSSLPDIHQDFSRDYGSSLAAVGATFGILGLFGSNANVLTDLWKAEQNIYPFPIDDSITTASLVSRADTNEAGRERWTIASPSMARNVGVDVLLGTGGPVVYFLEGIDSPETSSWIKYGHVQRVFSDTDVTVVIPAQGAGSM